jgi:integral membrane protein
MLSTPVGRLRLVGILEGISFLVLLGIAMPLKYLAGQPGAVKVVGWAHGALFVLYVGAALQATLAHGWSVGRLLGLLAASVLPFGPFVVDRRLRDEAPAPAPEA